jgi:hypothetical protein
MKKVAIDPEVAALLAKHNVKAPVIDEEVADYSNETPETQRFRAEGILYSLEYPLSPRVTKVCKREECKRPFLSNYAAVAYCGNECLALDLRQHFGIAWVPHNRVKKEKWEVRAPAQIIPLQALLAMKTIVAQAEADLGYQLELPVDVKPFVVKYPYFGERSASSQEEYRLPAPSQSELERYQAATHSSASESQPAFEIPQTQNHVSSQSPESPAPQSEQEKESPDKTLDDPFADLFAGL